MSSPIKDYIISPHALFEMQRREIDESILKRVMNYPDQRFTERKGRDVVQSKIEFDGKIYLVRVFVDVDRKPAEVVTVYRTSNIKKYWRTKS